LFSSSSLHGLLHLSFHTGFIHQAQALIYARTEDKKSYAGMDHPQNLAVELGNLALSIHKKAV
jgi:hypothetical protein